MCCGSVVGVALALGLVLDAVILAQTLHPYDDIITHFLKAEITQSKAEKLKLDRANAETHKGKR